MKDLLGLCKRPQVRRHLEQGWRLIRGGDAVGRERLQQQIDADLGAATGVALRAALGEPVYAGLLAAVVAARAG